MSEAAINPLRPQDEQAHSTCTIAGHVLAPPLYDVAIFETRPGQQRGIRTDERLRRTPYRGFLRKPGDYLLRPAAYPRIKCNREVTPTKPRRSSQSRSLRDATKVSWSSLQIVICGCPTVVVTKLSDFL